MKQIRKAIFETNSSSVHSLTMCSESEYQKWQDGELLLNEGWFDAPYNKQFLTAEEAVAAIDSNRAKWKPEEVGKPVDAEILKEYEIYTNETWEDAHEYFETFEYEYTTAGDETIIAFGYFGHD